MTTLSSVAQQHDLALPVIEAVHRSNGLHEVWLWQRIYDEVSGYADPRVALLGLTYKAGTDTLRRSPALAMAHWLAERGVSVSGYDPAINRSCEELKHIDIQQSLDGALDSADLVVLIGGHPEFRTLDAELIRGLMRHAQVLDPARSAPHLRGEQGLKYMTVGHAEAET